MVTMPSPSTSPASHVQTSVFPSAMFTVVRISSTGTVPSRLQSPAQTSGTASFFNPSGLPLSTMTMSVDSPYY